MPGALVVVCLLGLVALLLGSSRWLARRPWAALGNVALGIALLAVAFVLWPASRHLRSYERIPERGAVAHVHCERTAPGRYRVTLTRLPAGRMEVYELAGEQWRLDARTLVWTGTAAQLGLHPLFRFERLSARRLGTPAAATGGATPAPAAAMRLPDGYLLTGPDDDADDPWSQARAGRRWAGAIDAGLSYGPWQPLADGARFEVRISHAPGTRHVRLEARPQALGYTPPRHGPARAPRN